ncbi:low temperature requirement protein LtrA [Cryobacterium sp. MP_M5]|uniref:low temperature requirement protein A n=1 Tax=unclassified Cryobacterium TaxID=2649013 RepID=UPI0018CA6C51|nr:MULTISPECIES: low temperature requirement protein A [unclassified Cryobacterium]MBG6059028.1 low temperature requirement protein LtrA [Cryobacterium sp. MP_M3]MEC5177322.1 low temperature requirement protein LtrA [Cryobacterium sp. MP_M5]
MSNQPGGAPLSWASAAAFRRHFWQPPRAHGDVIQGREVSFLELFYDLVYVVVISQAAHHLSGDVTWAGVGRFAIVFGLIWLAWVNGATYHDLHGRSDGRTRSYVFLQMAVLGLLAVFTGEATAGDGPAFAAVYSAYLFLLAWLWYTVRRQDDPELRSRATPYIVGVVVSAALVGASALLPDTARLAVWAVVVVGWLGSIAVLDWRNGATRDTSVNVSASLIERFDLFTIIVLGEVVVGVVNGIADAGRTPSAIVTGILGLGIGFAYWWSYFDFVAASRVRSDRGAVARWLVGHLAVTMTIAATGGIMVSMVDHVPRSPTAAPAAMMLSVSVAVGALALVLVATSLANWQSKAPVYRPVAAALVTAAAVALVLGWLAPPPWLHILLLMLTLGAVWIFGSLTWFAYARRVR